MDSELVWGQKVVILNTKSDADCDKNSYGVDFIKVFKKISLQSM